MRFGKSFRADRSGRAAGNTVPERLARSRLCADSTGAARGIRALLCDRVQQIWLATEHFTFRTPPRVDPRFIPCCRGENGPQAERPRLSRKRKTGRGLRLGLPMRPHAAPPGLRIAGKEVAPLSPEIASASIYGERPCSRRFCCPSTCPTATIRRCAWRWTLPAPAAGKSSCCMWSR